MIDKKRVVEVRETGKSMFAIILEVLSDVGGLSSSLAGIFFIIENWFTWREIIGVLTKRLYTTGKDKKHVSTAENPKRSLVDDEAEQQQLLKAIKQGQVSKEQTNFLFQNLSTSLQPLKKFLSTTPSCGGIVASWFWPIRKYLPGKKNSEYYIDELRKE